MHKQTFLKKFNNLEMETIKNILKNMEENSYHIGVLCKFFGLTPILHGQCSYDVPNWLSTREHYLELIEEIEKDWHREFDERYKKD